MHGPAAGAGVLDDVGQIVLALGLLDLERVEQRHEPCGIERHDAGIAHARALQALVRVALLDDRGEAALIEGEAAIAAGIGRAEAQHRDRRGGGAPGVEQVAERLGGDQRRVAVEHQHLALLRQMRARRHDRVAGAELRLLIDDHRRQRAAIDLGGDRIHARRQDHDEPLGRERRRGRQHMRDHRAARQRMQHLRPLGAHARALAGSEQDDGNRSRHGGRTSERMRHGIGGRHFAIRKLLRI